MVNDVKARLQSLGYTVTDSDQYALEFAIEKTTWAIINACNVSAVPDGLRNIAVDMACGEFLSIKKATGQLPEDFDAEAAVKSIKEGDTQVTYAVGDMAAPFDWLVDYLTSQGKSQFVHYRRLSW